MIPTDRLSNKIMYSISAPSMSSFLALIDWQGSIYLVIFTNINFCLFVPTGHCPRYMVIQSSCVNFCSLVLLLASEEQTVLLLVHGHREFLREYLFIGALIG